MEPRQAEDRALQGWNLSADSSAGITGAVGDDRSVLEMPASKRQIPGDRGRCPHLRRAFVLLPSALFTDAIVLQPDAQQETSSDFGPPLFDSALQRTELASVELLGRALLLPLKQKFRCDIRLFIEPRQRLQSEPAGFERIRTSPPTSRPSAYFAVSWANLPLFHTVFRLPTKDSDVDAPPARRFRQLPFGGVLVEPHGFR